MAGNGVNMIWESSVLRDVEIRRIAAPRRARALLGAGLLALLAGCGAGGNGGEGAAKGSDKGPAEVGYVRLQPQDAAQMVELAGRTTAFEESQVRPQVSGLIHRRFFTEGGTVRAGQTLYQIDPSLYRAAGAEAEASLASAEAAAAAAQAKADRFKPLAAIEAVSKQDYTDALAQARQARAAAAEARARLNTARINLRFTNVPAPISGRIGRSLVTQGALVTANQAEPLAVIQRLDPIYVDMQQSASDLLALRRAFAGGGVAPGSASVRLTLDDGSDYGLAGTVEFSEAVVNESTGTVTLRARFPNPKGLLLPGMFVRAHFAQSVTRQAFLVPQQALSRDPKGGATVFVVGPHDRLEQRHVTADRTQGAFWVVTKGLNAGDKVVTEGLLQAKPGAVVRPVPAGSPPQPPRRGHKG